jgi:hypothetical protein
MNRLNQVNMSQTGRRFGLPQAALLTGAFATAVLLALVFRPAKIPTVELAPAAPISTPQMPPVSAEAERDTAQAKLAAAMARFANAPTKEAEPLASPPAPTMAPPEASMAPALTPAPVRETPAPMARVAEQQILAPPVAAPVPAAVAAPPPVPASAPAPILALRPTLTPMSDADMRRLGDKAAQALRDGDVYGARLILERAIEGGDANALFALAETYDPKGLARMNVKSVKADPVRARALYTQALDKGVAAARGRLGALDR